MRQNSLADLARSAFVLIAVCVATKADSANELCSATQVSSNDYKGRFFSNRHINSSASILNQTVPTVYGCHRLCETRDGCIALSFSPPPATNDNCMLYNLTNIQKYISPKAGHTVIVVLPIECQENSTVDGGWSSWESENGCVECLTSRNCRQTRKCGSPKSKCNGSPCAGSDERILEFTPCTDIGQICNVTEEDVYTFDMEGTVFHALVTASPNEAASIVIQRRFDGSVDFLKMWDDYKRGFGNLSGEFWLGNDNIHLLTSQQSVYLKIGLNDGATNAFAVYESVEVSNEEGNYMLSLGSYVGGDAGDSLSPHVGMMFTTKDRDNDIYVDANCAIHHEGGGWWFERCYKSNLNGRYARGNVVNSIGIIWESFGGIMFGLNKSEMRIGVCG